MNLLQFSYDVKEFIIKLFWIDYDFLESVIGSQNYDQLKTIVRNSRSLKNWKNLLWIKMNQLQTSQTGYELVTIQLRILKFINSWWFTGFVACVE